MGELNENIVQMNNFLILYVPFLLIFLQSWVHLLKINCYRANYIVIGRFVNLNAVVPRLKNPPKQKAPHRSWIFILFFTNSPKEEAYYFSIDKLIFNLI